LMVLPQLSTPNCCSSRSANHNDNELQMNHRPKKSPDRLSDNGNQLPFICPWAAFPRFFHLW
jgi:hypothetical protein